MGQKKSEFDKVFSAWDILVIAFGAMIGWGWVVSSGTWIDAGGVVGAALAFASGTPLVATVITASIFWSIKLLAMMRPIFFKMAGVLSRSDR